MKWYIRITPTYEEYAHRRLDLALRLAEVHSFDGLMLDFVRWPLHWELECRPGADPQHWSFDAHTIRQFEQFAQVSVPLQAVAGRASWILTNALEEGTGVKCAVITGFVRETVRRVCGVRSGLLAGRVVVPLAPAERELA